MWSISAVTLNSIDICDQLARIPDVFPRLADMLEVAELIAMDTALAVINDQSSTPYRRASKMIRPAIEQAKKDDKKYKSLVVILKKFNLKI